MAVKDGNEFEISWLNHSELVMCITSRYNNLTNFGLLQAWCNKLSRTERNFWQIHADENRHIFYNENDEYTEKWWHFTLPIPMYL